MSRSTKKTPIFGNTNARSEKQDKRKANRVFRKMTKRTMDEEETPAPPISAKLPRYGNLKKMESIINKRLAKRSYESKHRIKQISLGGFSVKTCY